MNNVIDISKREKVIDQASIWIARLDKRLSLDQETEFKQWLAESPEHFAELTKLAQLWDEMEVLSNLSDMIPYEQPQAKPARSFVRMEWAAACVFGFVLLAILLLGPRDAIFSLRPNSNQLVQENGVYETPIGGVSTIVLSDGSTLKLNTNTLVNINFENAKRTINLQRGEIHIDVAHDRSRPLSVIASGKVFEAVGTAFNVRIEDSLKVKLLVTDGKVKVLPQAKASSFSQLVYREGSSLFDGSDKIIAKGQLLELKEDSQILKQVTDSDVAAELSWKNQNIVFRGESLQEAIDEVSRYTTIELLIADDSLRELRVAGLFKAGDVSGFLASLDANFDIVYKQNAKKTLIYSRRNMPLE